MIYLTNNNQCSIKRTFCNSTVKNDFLPHRKKNHAYQTNVIEEYLKKTSKTKNFLKSFYVLVSFFIFTMVFYVFFTTAISFESASLLSLFYDFFKYNFFVALGYVHRTVNHRQHFVSPQGVHTNRIESLWAQCKYKFKRMYGMSRTFIPTYLDEFMWRRKRSKGRVLPDLFQMIRRKYPL